jgi:hypothetical protein
VLSTHLEEEEEEDQELGGGSSSFETKKNHKMLAYCSFLNVTVSSLRDNFQHQVGLCCSFTYKEVPKQ